MSCQKVQDRPLCTVWNNLQDNREKNARYGRADTYAKFMAKGQMHIYTFNWRNW